MHKIYFCVSIFYTLEDSAWCYTIQIVTIGDFNSFGFFGTPCIQGVPKKVPSNEIRAFVVNVRSYIPLGFYRGF